MINYCLRFIMKTFKLVAQILTNDSLTSFMVFALSSQKMNFVEQRISIIIIMFNNSMWQRLNLENCQTPHNKTISWYFGGFFANTWREKKTSLILVSLVSTICDAEHRLQGQNCVHKSPNYPKCSSDVYLPRPPRPQNLNFFCRVVEFRFAYLKSLPSPT